MTDNRIKVDTAPFAMQPFLSDIAVLFASFPYEFEPDIFFTIDGPIWSGATDPGRYEGGTSIPEIDGIPAAWTGDRFQVCLYNYSSANHSTLLQSFDGKNWEWHPDASTFYNAHLNVLASNGKKIVVAGAADLGPSSDRTLAISADAGESWRLIDDPLVASAVYDAACDGTRIGLLVDEINPLVYSIDAGATWQAGATAGIPADFEIRALAFCTQWIIAGYNGTDGAGDYIMYRSSDFLNWVPVITPWDNNYPPVAATSPFGGQINVLVVGGSDRRRLLAAGDGPGTDAACIVSDDAGQTWFEIGFDGSSYNDPEAFDPPFDRYLPVLSGDWSFEVVGACYAFDRWFLSTGDLVGGASPQLVAGAVGDAWHWLLLPGVFYTQFGFMAAATVPDG